MRCGTARAVVLYLKMGWSLDRAGREGMADLRRLAVPFPPRMNLVAVDARGGHTAMTTETARAVRYVYQTGRMAAPALRPRVVVPLRPAEPRRRPAGPR
jgi:L-asparaginase